MFVFIVRVVADVVDVDVDVDWLLPTYNDFTRLTATSIGDS